MTLREMMQGTEVACFGQCGAKLRCKCKRANKLCLVHGKYGSLCMGCFGNLVSDTVAREGSEGHYHE